MPTYPQYKRVPLIFFLDEVLRTGKIRKMEDVSVMFYDESLVNGWVRREFLVIAHPETAVVADDQDTNDYIELKGVAYSEAEAMKKARRIIEDARDHLEKSFVRVSSLIPEIEGVT